MENLLAAFSLRLKEWRTIKTMLIHLEQHGKSAKDLINHINEMIAVDKAFEEKTTKEFKQATTPCPSCKSFMRLFAVNINPATQTGDPTDKSVWLCGNEKCMYTIYNKETVEQLMAR